jgi:SAM-dependent methyltransferase
MELPYWPTDHEPIRLPFSLHRNRLTNWVGGRMMLMVSLQEVADLLEVPPGGDVLEVGYGSGALLRSLRQSPARRICGVDPSAQMRKMAQRRCPRADLRLGTAGRTGFADSEFDRVVSVNNVAGWPDLSAGLREMHRVTCPGGQVLIAWHGGRNDSRLAQRMALSQGVWKPHRAWARRALHQNGAARTGLPDRVHGHPVARGRPGRETLLSRPSGAPVGDNLLPAQPCRPSRCTGVTERDSCLEPNALLTYGVFKGKELYFCGSRS